MRDFLLSYDTVTLLPNYSSLESRSKADTTVELCGYKFKLPVVPANMKDVINPKIAKFCSENGYFYIYHRFGDSGNENLNTIHFTMEANTENWKLISISVGVNDESLRDLKAIKGMDLRVDFITIDVAHAHHDNIKKIFNYIRENFPKTRLIVGNIATYGSAIYLATLGADAIKVGIGGGSICTTRYMTGFHIPTLQSVQYAYDAIERTIPIIADGGAKHYGDVAKALVFGATMVMSGGWFASCIDSPAQIVNGKKVYRGSTSFEIKGQRKNIEGKVVELVEGTTVSQRFDEIKDALQSSISYAGGTDLKAFHGVNWARILPFH